MLLSQLLTGTGLGRKKKITSTLAVLQGPPARGGPGVRKRGRGMWKPSKTFPAMLPFRALCQRFMLLKVEPLPSVTDGDAIFCNHSESWEASKANEEEENYE